uniref:Small proline-rich protein 2G-like n=1 Tax=Diabrotica virgifera virgifera TaxID=50390 RepID=A0A6P7GYQ9_DIAVI
MVRALHILATLLAVQLSYGNPQPVYPVHPHFPSDDCEPYPVHCPYPIPEPVCEIPVIPPPHCPHPIPEPACEIPVIPSPHYPHPIIKPAC